MAFLNELYKVVNSLIIYLVVSHQLFWSVCGVHHDRDNIYLRYGRRKYLDGVLGKATINLCMYYSKHTDL